MNGPGPLAANYFDNAATTPLDPRVLEAMLPYLGTEFGNAHSIHSWGSRAMSAVEKAREQVANLLSEPPEFVHFTSGATEANNWVLREFATGVISPFEHSSVREPALVKGFEVGEFEGLLPKQSGGPVFEVQSLMLVNNETGTRWNPRTPIGPGGRFVHSDITQALGKIPVSGSVADFITASAHKVYGPKGVGIMSARQQIAPMILGGEQESGLRAGTLNVAGIVGFGAACELAQQHMEEEALLAKGCRETLLEELRAVSDWQVNGVPEVEWELCGSVPHILSLSFAGLEGETLVIEADNHGFAISAGAACSSRSTEPSHVLTAMGLPEQMIRGTIRISFGRFNTLEAAASLGKVLVRAVKSLRTY